MERKLPKGELKSLFQKVVSMLMTLKITEIEQIYNSLSEQFFLANLSE